MLSLGNLLVEVNQWSVDRTPLDIASPFGSGVLIDSFNNLSGSFSGDCQVQMKN